MSGASLSSENADGGRTTSALAQTDTRASKSAASLGRHGAPGRVRGSLFGSRAQRLQVLLSFALLPAARASDVLVAAVLAAPLHVGAEAAPLDFDGAGHY